MSKKKLILKPDEEETLKETGELNPGEIERDLYTDLVRLLIGGIFESGSAFSNWLGAKRDRQGTGYTSDQKDERFTTSRQAR